MEVATSASNNHSHNHLLQTHREQRRMPYSQNNLSVGLISDRTGDASIGGAHSPFQREVREWQRIDPDTGALLTGRLEADHWINGPMNSYGKISDSQNISQPNGTQHTQRKQLEVLQAHTANGAMQVIRAQTVQTTSSRWSSSTSSASSSVVPSPTTLGSLSNGHSNSFHNSSQLIKPYNNKQLSNNTQQNHFHSPTFSRLDVSLSSPPPPMSKTEISEISSNNCDSVRLSRRNSSNSSVSDVIDVEHDDKNNYADNDIESRHSFLKNHNLSLLMDTLDMAPSLKLSNLMKSNSSISSNNSSSNNSATAISNKAHITNSAAGKINLHAIVGGSSENTKRTSALTSIVPKSSSSSSSSLSSANWQHHQHERSSRLFEQPSLFGKNSLSSSFAKSRVGVSEINADETKIVVGAHVAAENTANDGGDARHHTQRNNNVTPTQLKSRQQQIDLESFRLGNKGSKAKSTANTVFDNSNDDGNDDNDVLRLTTRHSHRQQTPKTLSIQRSRSISTDDLSAERGGITVSTDDNEEPCEWKRVSKLRRSFQSSSSSRSDISSHLTKPIDLPNNSVSVAKIRAELENGRRLNTAMRNNHVDLAALDSILNGVNESSKPIPAKRTNFLTADSLKEIRAGLKKLSDETLYKDDYVTVSNTTAPNDHIEIQDVKKPPERIRSLHFTNETTKDDSTSNSAFQIVKKKLPFTSYVLQTPKHTTHSLESRQKHRDSATTIDWHLRRKSYGFEKMSPPDNKAMFRMDASTDSGLGRSGEQLGNWSPTDSNPPNTTRSTVIRFGQPEIASPHVDNLTKPTIQKRIPQFKSPKSDEDLEFKRHSIAVDESQYVRKASQVHINGQYDTDNAPKFLQTTRLVDLAETSSSTSQFHRSAQQKRVEFCKTEVHFAAESGRVNIVETDGKPPPTNNFRRRRRTASGPLQTLLKSSGIENTEKSSPRNLTRFGDTKEHQTLTLSNVAYRTSLIENHDDNTSSKAGNITVLKPRPISLDTFTHSDTTDGETDEISAIRGILKNKPIKPKPYHLGENIESADVFWISSSTAPSTSATSSSVAERIRIVEQRQDSNSQTQTNNFSTKINLCLGDDIKLESSDTKQGADYVINNQKRPSLQEIMLEDLRERQRMLDEGLKSTSLIMKTMRSANEFDEAMRRLSIASMEATIMSPIVVPTPMIRSHSYQETSESFSSTTLDSISNSCSTNLNSAPVAQPRLKLLGNTEIPISQQLTQLRRMYDWAAVASSASQDEDSADEEVKRLFNKNVLSRNNSDSGSGSETQQNSLLDDVRFTETSGSWSRLKAKRTILRIGSIETKKVSNALEPTDLPKSNVMSIELHSPQLSLEKTMETQQIAKPRITTFENLGSSVASTVKTETNADFLKISKETRGARKLREHELSFFGVPVPAKNTTTEIKKAHVSKTQLDTQKRKLLQRRPNEHEQIEASTDLTKQQTASKWQLMNDKPDLLRHSPTTVDIKPMQRKSLCQTNKSRIEDDEHIYENIAIDILKPIFKVQPPENVLSPNYDYNRKSDLSRDALNLSEMTQNADQTMKALNEEAAIKDQRRRLSLQRRNSKPLETIDEKTIAEKISDKCIAVQISRSTVNSEGKRSSRHATPTQTTISSRARSSSQSSNESCSRARERSRSLSSERGYENTKTRPKHPSQSPVKTTSSKVISAGKVSRESLHPRYGSSGDENDDRKARDLRSMRYKQIGERQGQREGTKHFRDSDDRKKRTTSSTAHSSRSERVECNGEVKIPHQDHQHHGKNYNRINQRQTAESSSSRRHKEDHKSVSHKKPATSDKHDREKLHVGEQSRHHSSHRSERETDKEKQSRSRDHSSRSVQRKSEKKRSSSHEKHNVVIPTKSREHRKPTLSYSQQSQRDIKHSEPQLSSTHSKSAPHHQQLSQSEFGPSNRHHQHIHSLTTATIAAKQRDHRSGKDRK